MARILVFLVSVKGHSRSGEVQIVKACERHDIRRLQILIEVPIKVIVLASQHRPKLATGLHQKQEGS